MAFRNFAKGRKRALDSGIMNKLEQEYAGILEMRRLAGEIDWWKYEAIKFRLTQDKCFYTPDFVVQLSDGIIEVHETKGHWEEDALLKIKFAAEQFPFRFVAVGKRPKKEGGGWWTREFGARKEDVKND